RDVPELGRTLGEELLEPTRIYAKACLALARADHPHAMAHVTGGGLAANLARIMPEELYAVLERGTWTPPPVFDLIRGLGDIPQPDLEATLNCGVGMVALVQPEVVDAAIALLGGFGIHSWVAGEVLPADADAGRGSTVELVGQHPGW
ncbi:MAG TPA: AIR synthase-related protein, partial [Nocardioides sp.]|nr:AIR synthase-related protein [Nocardioides sp.]